MVAGRAGVSKDAATEAVVAATEAVVMATASTVAARVQAAAARVQAAAARDAAGMVGPAVRAAATGEAKRVEAAPRARVAVEATGRRHTWRGKPRLLDGPKRQQGIRQEASCVRVIVCAKRQRRHGYDR